MPHNLLEWFRLLSRVRDKAFSLMVARSFFRFGSRSTLCLPIRLGGADRVEIGDRVYVGAGCWIESLADDDFTGVPVISIGSGTSFSGYCTVTAVSRVSIGKNVLIARHVHISDHFHAFHDPVVPVKEQGVDRIADVVVKEGAWIGHGVVICPGVTIGRNAVIGANSVVREDVPDHCVAAGVPARILRRPHPMKLSPASL